MRRWIVLALLLVAILALLMVTYQGVRAPVGGPQIADSQHETPSHARSTTNLSPAKDAEPEDMPAVERAQTDDLGTITGNILMPDGLPAAQALVQIRATNGNPEDTAFQTPTDGDGHFAVDQLPFGWYGIYATWNDLAAFSAGWLRPHQSAVEVTLVLAKGSSISGSVLGDDGAGVPSAIVFPVVHDDDGVDRSRALALVSQSADDGRFVTPVLPERMWQFEVYAAGYATTISPPIPAGTEDARIYLQRGGVQAGRVLDVDSELPISGIALEARAVDSPGSSRDTEADDTGAFQFTHLVNGVNRIRSVDPDYVLAPESMTVEIAGGTPDDEVVLYACKGAVVAGSIVDISGNPVAGMSVEARSTDSRTNVWGRHGSSDAWGAYRVTGLGAGTYELSISELSHIPLTRQSVTLEQGEVRSGIDFVLPLGVSVQGQVFMADGSPAPGAAVEGRYFSGPFAQGQVHATTGQDGSFRLFGPEPGSELFIHATSGTASSLEYGPIIVAPESVHDVHLNLEQAQDGVISGVVVSDTGQPLRCVLALRERRADGSVAYTSQKTTGWDGSFAFTVITPGHYELFAGPYQGGGVQNPTTSLVQLPLGAGQSERGLRLTYSEDREYVISGRVVDGDGAPVSSALINVLGTGGSPDEPLPSSSTNSDGEFTLALPADGTYRLVAVAQGYPAQHHEVHANTTLTITLENAPRLQGRVIDATTGDPVPSYSVAVVPIGVPRERARGIQSINNSQGTFSIETSSNAGTGHEILVFADGYAEARVAIDQRSFGSGTQPVAVSLVPQS